ncbi:MAG: metal-sensitive transcriptional regulator [Microthrixaceae bacterium]|nr:metal-sensitive transcriptional regulator [Microthrixaceae bacterium]
MVGYDAEKDQYLKRLKRIEGQVRGIAGMIEDDRYCIDVLTQVSAVTRALQGVAVGLMDEHLKHCVSSAMEHGGDEADEKLAEAMGAIKLLLKS